TPPPQPPPPAMLTISAPADITAPATMPCGQTYCAQVMYTFTVSGGTPPYTLGCNLPSGGEFTVGAHTVSCMAQDSAGNSTPQASFTVTVTHSTGGGGSATNGTTPGSVNSSSSTTSSQPGGETTNPSSTSDGKSDSGTVKPTSAFVITAPSIVVPRTGTAVSVKVTTRHTVTTQKLCWRAAAAKTKEACVLGHGAWHIKLVQRGTYVLVLETRGRLVARKTITVGRRR